MKKVCACLVCIILLLGAVSCGYPDRTQECPQNWPTYRVASMMFPCEAGWSGGDAGNYPEYAEESFPALSISDDMVWVAYLQSPANVSGVSNYLAVSYLELGEEVTGEMLEAQADQLQNVKKTFEKAGSPTFIQNFPEVGKYGDNLAVYFSGRFTLENNKSVIGQFALMGHGTRLYQLAYMDFTDPEEDNEQLCRILSGLKMQD